MSPTRTTTSFLYCLYTLVFGAAFLLPFTSAEAFFTDTETTADNAFQATVVDIIASPVTQQLPVDFNNAHFTIAKPTGAVTPQYTVSSASVTGAEQCAEVAVTATTPTGETSTPTSLSQWASSPQTTLGLWSLDFYSDNANSLRVLGCTVEFTVVARHQEDSMQNGFLDTETFSITFHGTLPPAPGKSPAVAAARVAAPPALPEATVASAATTSGLTETDTKKPDVADTAATGTPPTPDVATDTPATAATGTDQVADSKEAPSGQVLDEAVKASTTDETSTDKTATSSADTTTASQDDSTASNPDENSDKAPADAASDTSDTSKPDDAASDASNEPADTAESEETSIDKSASTEPATDDTPPDTVKPEPEPTPPSAPAETETTTKPESEPVADNPKEDTT